MSELRDLFEYAASRAADYRDSVGERPVFPAVDLEVVRAALGALADGPVDAAAVIAELADIVEPALVASTGPRYFGFVTGGALPAPSAADMLATAWDQNAFNRSTAPGAALVEAVAGTWLLDLLELPQDASFGFVTGGQAANTVGLAAARHHVLAATGWDVERDGLAGGPRVRVVANADRHATIDASLRLLGLGDGALEPVASDSQGSIDVTDLSRVLADGPAGPTIVCLQAGNVNSGAFDDFVPAIAAAHAHGAWVHVDGAFGLWAAANPATRHLVAGVSAADSWATDGHKWLNVPYDSGYACCAHPAAHAAAMSYSAAYLTGQGEEGGRLSRRLRAGILPAGAGLRDVGGPAPAGSPRGRRAGRALLRPRPPVWRAAGGDRRRRDPERHRAQPGPRQLRR